MTNDSARLLRALDGLKAEFFAAGEEYSRSKDKALIAELHALTASINALEDFVHGRRITRITDFM